MMDVYNGVHDFSVSTLGECRVDNPIKLSSQRGNFISNYVKDDEAVRFNVDIYEGVLDKNAEAYNNNFIQKAGPREKIYFRPEEVHAAICSCGGLCPGINDVIRSLVITLWHRYGVRHISGIRYGYNGFLPETAEQPIPLDPATVDAIHKTGGSFLSTSRGGGERTSEIVDRIAALGINMLFTIGGDGTQKGSLAIAREIEKRGLKIAIVGIPKTIDNDFIMIQKSFGFDTAVAKAKEAVASAHMEALSSRNGVGLVKLMGRESGFIAVHTALASHEANFCLIPEIPFDLEGENGFLVELEKRLAERNHAVIVLAEGAGQEHMESTGETDASGNRKLGDIGLFMKGEISRYFKERKINISMKYIDPSYMIRSAVAIAPDSVYCERLASNAVHAAMAGKTKIIIGLVHNKYVHLPINLVVAKRNRIKPEESLWRDVLESTGQPLLMVNDREKLIADYKASQNL